MPFLKNYFLNNEIKAFTLKTHFSASSSARKNFKIRNTFTLLCTDYDGLCMTFFLYKVKHVARIDNNFVGCY